jgi:DNA-directed RNA polymerase subunit M/transcription elongation factor TFIIS
MSAYIDPDDSDQEKDDEIVDEKEEEKDTLEDEDPPEDEEQENEDPPEDDAEEEEAMEEYVNEDEDVIKLDNATKVEIGDLDKINRNYLKLKYSQVPPISKTTLKTYKIIVEPVRTPYKYLSNENLREDAEGYLHNEDAFYEWINKESEADVDKYVNDLYQLQKPEGLRRDDFQKPEDLYNGVLSGDIWKLTMLSQYEQNIIDCKKLTEELQAESTTETCNRCKNDKVMSLRLQTRGGDEGYTTFYLCTKCKCQWKQ